MKTNANMISESPASSRKAVLSGFPSRILARINTRFFVNALFLIASIGVIPSTVNANDFVLSSAHGESQSALLLSAQADVKVSGLMVFGKITQKYLNNGPDFIAGQYVFPLPESASIHSLVVKIGGRVIESKLREKQQAKTEFEQAKSSGKQAALLQQDRPNLFRMAVSNIAAGETIQVELSYLDTLHYDQSTYTLRIPTTLTPRYNATGTSVESELIEQTTVVDSLDSFLNPVFAFSADDELDLPQNPIKIRVELNTGYSANSFTSNSHDITVLSQNDNRHTVELTQGFESMDRDFHLQWQQNNSATTPAIYIETVSSENSEQALEGSVQEEHYVMLSLMPTAPQFSRQVLPKDITFIIDTSGSMGGEPMRQAKAALIQGLDKLGPHDNFNIIEFNSTHSSLFGSSRSANSHNLSLARQFVDNLNADGGTEMKPALLEALRHPAQSPEHLKQVVFITDGAVGNESELSRVVHQFLGDARLFSVGIGSAPNQYLFRQLSKLGKGTAIQIGQAQDVQKKMQLLFDKISTPAMRNIEVHYPQGKILEIQPSNIPDLYYGEPLQVLLKVSDTSGELRITGELANQPVDMTLQFSQSSPAEGISTIWGKQKIRDLMDKIHLQQGDPKIHEQAVIDLSLKHHVLSQYTSYVAVDDTAVRLPNQALKEIQVANLTPEGMAFPKTALGTMPAMLLSILSILLAGFINLRRLPAQTGCA